MNMKYAMQIIAFVLTVACLSLPAFAADGVQATLDRLANMDFNEQQTWLRQLEKRADKAARIALSPDDAKQAQAEISDLLHRETVTWAVLRQAIEKTESLEGRASHKLTKRADDLIKKGVIPEHEYDKLDGMDNPPQAETSGEHQPKPVPSPILRPMPELAVEPTPSAVEEMPKQPTRPNVIDEPALPIQPKVIVESPPIEPDQPELVEEPKKPVRPRHSLFDQPMETRVVPPERSAPSAPAVTSRKMPPGAVKINTDELGVRIAGCNMAFRALESDLDEAGPWNAKSIEPLLDRLEILSIRRDDLMLYRDLLSEGKRARIAKLESPKTAVSRLGARIFQVRRAINSPGFDGTEAQRRSELARLEMLSQRLAKAAGTEKAADKP